MACRPPGMLWSAALAFFGLMLSVDAARADPVLKIAGPIFPPYYEDDGQAIRGPLAAMLQMIAETAHYHWTFKLYTAPRLTESLIHGDADCTLLTRNGRLDSSGTVLHGDRPLAAVPLNLYSLNGAAGPLGRDDLKHRSIIVMRGYGYGGLRAWMDESDNDVGLIEANGSASAVAMLAARRAPLALLYEADVETALETLAPLPAPIVASRFQRLPLYLYVGKDADADGQAVLDRLMASYDALVKNGVFGPPDSRPETIIRKGS